jgi:Ca-activated chloride channel family protein
MNQGHKIFLIILMIGFQTFAQDWKTELNLARKAYQNGNYSEALEQYRNIEKKLPNTIDITSEIGQAAYRAGNYELAEEYFNKSNSKTSKSSNKHEGFHNLGNTFMKKKNYDQAIESYKNALKSNPSDQETRYNMSEAIRQRNKLSKKNQEPNSPNPKSNQNNPDNQNQNNQNQNNQSNGNQPNKEGDLPKRMVDRLLDQLTKNESKTKRKINSSKKPEKQNSKSNMDW